MNIYRPYTYLIGWSKLDYWYYGCQHSKNHANPDNLWKKYFTSSDYVAIMRQWHGEPDVVEVRYIFKTGKQALRCEKRVLAKINAVKSPRWLNKGNAGEKFNSCGIATREKIRQKALGRTAWNKGIPNEQQRQRMLTNNPMKNPIIANKAHSKLIGRPTWNKGLPATNKRDTSTGRFISDNPSL